MLCAQSDAKPVVACSSRVTSHRLYWHGLLTEAVVFTHVSNPVNGFVSHVLHKCNLEYSRIYCATYEACQQWVPPIVKSQLWLCTVHRTPDLIHADLIHVLYTSILQQFFFYIHWILSFLCDARNASSNSWARFFQHICGSDNILMAFLLCLRTRRWKTQVQKVNLVKSPGFANNTILQPLGKNNQVAEFTGGRNTWQDFYVLTTGLSTFH